MRQLWLIFAISTSALAQTQVTMDGDTPVALLPSQASTQAGNSLLSEAENGEQRTQTVANNAAISVVAEPNPALATGGRSASMTAWSGYAAAESLATNGNPELALKQIDVRLIQAPDDAKAAYLKGLILMQLSRGEEAERWFKMMQSNFPTLSQPYNALAVIYTGRGDLLSAENTLQALLAQHPNDRTAQENLAKIYVKLARASYQKLQKAKAKDATIAQTIKLLEQIDK